MQRHHTLKMRAGAALPLAFALTLICNLSHAQQAWKPVEGHIMTRWAKDVSPSNALVDYPRPQMVRAKWVNLNGLWDYALTDKDDAEAPASWSGKILVPYPWESALSGVAKASIPDQRLWYHRSFSIPSSWKGQRVLLHFGAVNWDSSVLVNGREIGRHRGGYDGFSFDITDNLKPGENQIDVSAWNPVLSDTANAQVLGKQRLHPGGIFYTPSTGIWQTVWLEPEPASHISGLKITPDIDNSSLQLTVKASGGEALKVKAIAFNGKEKIAEKTGDADTELSLSIPNEHLWNPEDPHLYTLKVALLSNGKQVDNVESYFAMRKVSLGKDEQGRTRIFLNNKFVFEMGALDQGFWPDGIYTAPTDAALRYDIEVAKKLGFNLLRKHAKVEPDRWYYWADKLGMLVWQDMPQMFGGQNGALSDEAKQQFIVEWKHIIADLIDHPSIIVWTTFNEGWGQHDTPEIVALTKKLDPTRLVNNASGWTDMKVGDMVDTHSYPAPSCELPTADRASVDGEFGGLGMRVDGHMWAKGSWGYQGVYSQAYQLTKKYQELLRNVYDLKDNRGMSAAVYTQITDVEEESNGLLTYDRAVIKPDITIVAAANKGKFLPLPPNPHPDPVPTSK
jgi:beta-galactosidase/beta-glucuronidase